MAAAFLAEIAPGGYISPWKALPVVLLLFVWARLLTWIDKDSSKARLHRVGMNVGMFSGLVLGNILFFLLPGFGPAIAALLGCFFVSIGTYLGIRAKVVGLGDLKEELKAAFTREKKDTGPAVATAGQVLIMDRSGAPAPIPPNDDPAARMPYDAAQMLLHTPLRLNAERIDVSPSDATPVTYTVDGVRYQGEVLERNTIGAAIQYLKPVAGLDIGERRKPQTGNLKVMINQSRHEMQLTTSGSTAGESARMIIDPKKRFDFKLDTLGFSADQFENVKKSIDEGGGVVLVSAPKGQGLTSLLYTVIRAHDAFMYHVHTVERDVEYDLEGITQNKLPPGATGADEAKSVSWVISQEPDVVMLTSIEDPKSAVDLTKYATDTRRVYVGLRAGNTIDALKQWRKLVGDDALAMKNLKMVISGRLVRKLCTACKVGFAPDPATLRKLNMNPDNVGTLYMARKEPMRDTKGHIVPCTFCQDLAFKGRTGVYEVFMVNDEVRQMVQSGGTENQLKHLFRKQRAKLLQEQALALVEAGETSIEEVLRVLKADGSSAAAPASGTGGTKPPTSGTRPPAPGGKPPATGGARPPGGTRPPTKPAGPPSSPARPAR